VVDLDGHSLTFKHVSATIVDAHGDSYGISRRICETTRYIVDANRARQTGNGSQVWHRQDRVSLPAGIIRRRNDR
jgi:hypothetical protein